MNLPQYPVFVALSVALLIPSAPAAERAPDVWARSVLHEDGSRTEASRDANAQVIESKTFDKSGKMIMRRVIQTDGKGIPRQGVIFDGNDKPVYKLSLAYDEIDRLSETSLFTASGEPVTKVLHRYGADGDEIAPSVQHFANLATPKPGEILPAAAMAAPGDTEAVLAGPAAPESPEGDADDKKRGIFKFFKKKK